MSFTPSMHRATRVLALAAGLACSGFVAAQATPPESSGKAPTNASSLPAGQNGAQTQAQRERERCLNGTSGQDQATCLREVGAAKEEAKKGNLDTNQGQLDQNRTDRCKVLSGADRDDCYARMRGEGTVDGSVKGGGIIREKRTVIPAPGPATTPGSTAAGSRTAPSGTTSTTK